jgi:hypothetical protein
MQMHHKSQKSESTFSSQFDLPRSFATICPVTAKIRRGVLSVTVFALICVLYVWLTSKTGHTARRMTGSVQPDPAAEAYAAALQDGDLEKVVELTCWMQERMLRVQIQTEVPENRMAERAELVRQLRDRSPENNFLRKEGVEDQYIFAPSVHVECIGIDAGRGDLERPARSRTWFRVTYPSQHGALRNENGAPVHSLTVGVDISKEGYVLKASVLGNLDIDWPSISYKWD